MRWFDRGYYYYISLWIFLKILKQNSRVKPILYFWQSHHKCLVFGVEIIRIRKWRSWNKRPIYKSNEENIKENLSSKTIFETLFESFVFIWAIFYSRADTSQPELSNDHDLTIGYREWNPLSQPNPTLAPQAMQAKTRGEIWTTNWVTTGCPKIAGHILNCYNFFIFRPRDFVFRIN